MSRDLTDYERGYLDALLEHAYWRKGEAVVGKGFATYKAEAERFLRGRGLDGWTVNVKPVPVGSGGGAAE